ncbi:thiamine phosphate synthase [Imtechella halotolerans]|uniref:Thiamine monophosphate synthase n=1 Tax=Imtechella halotolerans K1 TaxID=946077 RepID=I0WDF5_9FLAO|nr:thiamine phosphate synthase [Imtechella halotolerans]EID74421.1 thiamine monophosphate synthase [Imtechella halotolerans K1]WMQ62225.1 thiamine phosphate synthase [Imtechella halotolerans]
MKVYQPELIVITKPENSTNETYQIIEMFQKGLAVLHLRKPTLSEDETIEFLNTIPEQYHERIVIHQHYKCINTYNLKGIHFPEAIRKDSSLMQGYLNYFGDKGISISTSFHSPEALLGKQEAIFQYAFLGPVFNSISKPGYNGKFFNIHKELLPFPVYAIGGITPEHISKIPKMGFSGVAALGYIWNNPNPVKAFEQLSNYKNYFSKPL